MKALLVINNVVENVVVVDSLEDLPDLYKYIEGVNIGDILVDGIFIKQEKKISVEEITRQLAALTVTTNSGNVFDANVQARLDISNGILVSDAVGITETIWRLADDSEVLVTVAELKEALMLALTEYARIKGIGA